MQDEELGLEVVTSGIKGRGVQVDLCNICQDRNSYRIVDKEICSG
jgi:hypothetical protein